MVGKSYILVDISYIQIDISYILVNISHILVDISYILVDISCFHDYDQELALSLLCYLEIGRENHQK